MRNKMFSPASLLEHKFGAVAYRDKLTTISKTFPVPVYHLTKSAGALNKSDQHLSIEHAHGSGY